MARWRRRASRVRKRAQGHDIHDVSDDIAGSVKGGLAGHFTPRQMHALLEKLFVTLMRLDDTPPSPDQLSIFYADAHLDNIVVQGTQLIVRFYSIPKPLGNL
jgi:hypothetical protein